MTSFFADLKRRNVFRVAAGYVVAGWLIVQVVETIFPAFGFGDATVRIVVIVLGIGFVPVLIFAWVFELTPEGLKKEKDIDRSKPIAGGSGNRLNFVIIGLFALSLGYFAYDKLVLEPGRNAAASLNAVEVLAEVRELVDSSLGGGDFTDAYDLAIKAEEVIPDHAELQELIARSSLLVNISSNPAGASVYMKKYSQPEADWTWVGETPLAGLRLPIGIFRWKIEKEALLSR